MLRRIPYIKIVSDEVKYICPQCKSEIPRDLYRTMYDCPVCYSSLNKTCKSIMRVYKDIDTEMYNHFIKVLRR